MDQVTTNVDVWLVYDNEEGVVYIGTDYNKALDEYEFLKCENTDCVSSDGFSGDERVILAKIVKDFVSYDTGVQIEEPIDNEFEGATYWDFKENVLMEI